MRLLILGPLEGYISTAGKIAMSRGAKVAHVGDIDSALNALRYLVGRRLRSRLWTFTTMWPDAPEPPRQPLPR